jgi:hypothetical protein
MSPTAKNLHPPRGVTQQLPLKTGAHPEMNSGQVRHPYIIKADSVFPVIARLDRAI